MNQDYIRDYHKAHASKAHDLLKKDLTFPMEEFVLLDEFLVDFYSREKSLAIQVLEEDHDHADSYYVEAQMQKELKEQGISILFVSAKDIIDGNVKIPV